MARAPRAEDEKTGGAARAERYLEEAVALRRESAEAKEKAEAGARSEGAAAWLQAASLQFGSAAAALRRAATVAQNEEDEVFENAAAEAAMAFQDAARIALAIADSSDPSEDAGAGSYRTKVVAGAGATGAAIGGFLGFGIGAVVGGALGAAAGTLAFTFLTTEIDSYNAAVKRGRDRMGDSVPRPKSADSAGGVEGGGAAGVE
jgi:hypothetical protein